MPEELPPLVIAGLGVLGTLAVQTFSKLFDRWIADGSSRQVEQKHLAQEILSRVERVCGELVRTRWPTKEPANKETLELLRDEISSRSVGLTDARARAHMESIDTALWFVLNPDVAEYTHVSVSTNPHPIKMAARAVLGTIQRGETVPASLPMLRDLLTAANDVDAYMEGQARAEAAV